MTLLWVALGGAVGSVLRYGLGQWLNPDQGWPWGTLAVNLLGSLLLGCLFGALGPQHRVWALAATGFCGGFTTFSAFALENIRLLQQGMWGMALGYVFLSLLGGVALAFLGYWVGRSLA